MLAETSSIKWEITQWRQQMWKRGEDIAASYLERLGWKILERNWYAKRFGELDIIARDPTGLLVFVEVKARIDPLEPGISQVGFESVGRSKQQKLIKAARWYISEHQRYTSGYRFDVIVVTFDEEAKSNSAATTFSNKTVGAITGCRRELRNASFLDSKLIVHVKQAFP